MKHLQNGHLTLTQEPVNSNDTTEFTLPLDILDNSARISQQLIKQTPIQVHKSADFLIADPNMIAYQRSVYNVSIFNNK